MHEQRDRKKKIVKGQLGLTAPTLQYPQYQPTISYGLPNVSQQFLDNTALPAHQIKLKTGLLIQDSNDPRLQFEGRKKASEAINETTAPLDLPTGNSVVNETFLDKFNDSTFGKNYKGWSKALDAGNQTLTGVVGDKMFGGPKGNITQAIDSGWNSVADAASSFGPYGQIVSLAMKGLNVFNKGVNAALGSAALDNMTTTDAILNNPLTGWNVGLINALGGANADTITKDETVQETIGSSYGGSYNKIDDALTKSGKRYGLFSGSQLSKANSEIAEANRQQAIMTGIADEASDRFAIRNSMSAIKGNQRAFALQGGYNQSTIRAGREGLSLKTIMTAKKIVSSLKYKSVDRQERFKEGGSLPQQYVLEEVFLDSVLPEFKEGGKFNIIPEGALHARLHHMDNSETLTKKGIPVVSEKEGGDIEQQAEIEREEIIFRLSVTQKLEELQKKFYSEDSSQKEKDNLAIEAGKLLVDEILNNTIDNTGLLNTIN